ncbi:hypothetical protein B7P34_18355 [Streptosporangium nondiastaticum]|uniref:DUF2752 domain-containing protein n=1 Tax=Streptosporangium nondiastaticum TaxID=35764 RepID=A0A9X7PGT0_9ACTN|nr:DUF2752 domain-containing protein [Streptosporangium nondiastaticum]PSJ27296.1 hypothetical protein B7P34_18355 [Streptosporangium nondiastaticum]
MKGWKRGWTGGRVGDGARRIAAPLGVAGGLAAAAGYVAAVDPNRPGRYPACPLLRCTGLYCPGCGGLRGLHALTHGDLPGALGANALAVAAYAAFAVFWCVWFTRALRGRGGVSLSPRARHWWGLGAVVTLFTVLRNLPVGTALAP